MLKTPIGGGFWLDAPAATAYAAMRRDGCPEGITSAGRTFAEQAALYARYLRDLATGRKPPRQASPPGSARSKHEKGTALDLPEPARAWVRNHGSAYGWYANQVKGEPWHFEFLGATTTPTIPATQEETDMRLVRNPAGTIYEVTPTAITPITKDGNVSALDDYNAIAKVWGPYVQLTEVEFQGLIRSVARQRKAQGLEG